MLLALPHSWLASPDLAPLVRNVTSSPCLWENKDETIIHGLQGSEEFRNAFYARMCMESMLMIEKADIFHVGRRDTDEQHDVNNERAYIETNLIDTLYCSRIDRLRRTGVNVHALCLGICVSKAVNA
jgi:hypothetical protein